MAVKAMSATDRRVTAMLLFVHDILENILVARDFSKVEVRAHLESTKKLLVDKVLPLWDRTGDPVNNKEIRLLQKENKDIIKKVNAINEAVTSEPEYKIRDLNEKLYVCCQAVSVLCDCTKNRERAKALDELHERVESLLDLRDRDRVNVVATERSWKILKRAYTLIGWEGELV